MKSIAVAMLVPVVFSGILETCGEGVPVITEINFPPEIPGDSTSTEGTFIFTDSDAGVRYAYLDSVVCPTGWTCPEADYDLLLANPNVIKYTSAEVTFTHSCSNASIYDAWFTYSWTLEDIDGNVSQPLEFTYTCTHTGTSTTPVITDLSFPSEIEGNGVNYTGTLSYQDGNAGITTLAVTPVVCPNGFSCPAVTYNAEDIDPDFDTYYEGSVIFPMSCTNLSGSNAYIVYQWTLTDVEGHVSDPAQFGFTCLSPSSVAGAALPGDEIHLGSPQRGSGSAGPTLTLDLGEVSELTQE